MTTKTLLTLSVLTLMATQFAQAAIEPTTAFESVYKLAVQAVQSQYQSSEVEFGPKANVERNKNSVGEFADFKVQLEVDRIGNTIENQSCQVNVYIGKTETLEPNIIILEGELGSTMTFARVRVRCQ